MSGKAPPRAPRALLNSLHGSSAAAASASSSSNPSTSSASRIGATPPTGPRSLLNGQAGARGRGGKPYVNGHAGIPTGPAVAPSAFKGKQVDIDAQPNGAGPSRAALPQEPTTALNARHTAISFKLRPSASSSSLRSTSSDGPQPPTSPRLKAFAPPPSSPGPPPPPPPSEPPPPPPPPTTEPPPPPPPSTDPPPPPPPSNEPPPPPPPSAPPPAPSEPPPPPPPTSAPPLPPLSPPPPPPPSFAPPPLPSSSSIPLPPSSPPPLPPDIPPPIPSTSAVRLPPTGPRRDPFTGVYSGQPHGRLPIHIPTGPRAHRGPSPPIPQPPSEPPPPRPPSPQLYSLPPPPPWPPEPSEFPPGKNWKVLFDYAIDKDREGQYRALAEKLREKGMDQGDEPRVRGKGKGKEIILRYGGEVIEGEHEAVVRDPRKETKMKRLPSSRPGRTELVQCKYEFDANSTGPLPPTSVLVQGISPLIPKHHLRQRFGMHGMLVSFEPQLDRSSGLFLGIVFIKYSSHEEAKKCVAAENRKKLNIAVPGLAEGEGEELRVVFDGEGKVLKAVTSELDRRAREKQRREKEEKEKHLKPTPTSSASQTPVHANNPWRTTLRDGGPHNNQRQLGQHNVPRSLPPNAHLPMRPQGLTPMSMVGSPAEHGKASPLPNGTPTGPRNGPARVRRPAPPTAPFRARHNVHVLRAVPPANIRPPIHLFPNGIEAGPVLPPQFGPNVVDTPSPVPFMPSRSPSPVSRRPQYGRGKKKIDYDVIKAELAKNGFDHIAIDGHVTSVEERDVEIFMVGFVVDKILRDRHSWYVTFKDRETAHRAAMVLNGIGRKLAHHAVTVTVRPAPTHIPTAHKTEWTDAELLEQVEKQLRQELRSRLEKDIVERVVASQVRKRVAEERAKKGVRVEAVMDGHAADAVDHESKYLDRDALRGLSFRTKKKRPREEAVAPVEAAIVAEEEVVVERPKKKLKKSKKVVVEEKVIESEDEQEVTAVVVPEPTKQRKRAMSEASEVEIPVKKKAKSQQVQVVENDVVPVRTKKSKKTAVSEVVHDVRDASVFDEEVVHEVLPESLPFEPPAVDQVHVTTPFILTPSPLPSPNVPASIPLPPSAILDPIAEGICEDEEDVYFAKLALERMLYGKSAGPEDELEPEAEPDIDALFRKHVTGSARTEGYYKISHTEKSAYVAQYALRGMTTTVATEAEQAPPPKPAVASSRSNRANARRRAQGLEEINQVQRAMALSKGEAAAPDSVKYNQLQTRKKHLRFARSPIHDWGLYAMEKINRGDLVIEYVGEVIRAQVADKREKAYERQGIGSSYLFRIDEDLVVDATKKGNLGRLINHSCDPNCTAKIITISGEKKIVIYAKQDIELGSEITYDYHFPIEQDKIPCLCGSAKCRGTLN
ncbi:hypothetical protein V8D89_000039 [Ganoderma adspersum]